MAIVAAALVFAGCEDNTCNDYYLCNVLTDSLVVSARADESQMVNVTFSKNNKFCVFFYDEHNDYALWSDYNYLIVGGKIVGKDTHILFDVDKTQVEVIKQGNTKKDRHEQKMKPKEYRDFLKTVAPQKMQARWHTLLYGIILVVMLIMAASASLIKNSKIRDILYGIISIVSVALGIVYFQFNPKDSLWFITDAGGLGWLGLLVFIFFITGIAMYIIDLVKDKNIRQNRTILFVCLILAALLLAYMIVLFVVAFWEQAQYIIWSVLIVFLAPSAMSAGTDTLMSGGGRSGNDSSSGEEIEFGDGHRLEGRSSIDGETFYGNDGKTYHRDGMGRGSWKSE